MKSGCFEVVLTENVSESGPGILNAVKI